MNVLPQIGDKDIFDKINSNDLWCFDKLILSKKLGYICGPAGIAPPIPEYYIVRPIINLKMMSVGAKIEYLDSDSIPDGYFWCELFSGRHFSFDYYWGKQVLSVEGFRDNPTKLNKFNRWTKIDYEFKLPKILQDVADKYEWFNAEVIGDKVIEVHFRYNDDFANHNANTIIPIWQDEFYSSPAGNRIGFLLKDF